MTVLYSSDVNICDTSIELIEHNGLKIDMWASSSTYNLNEIANKLSEGSCLLVDTIETLAFSIKGLASFLEYAYNNSLRVISLDGKIDIKSDMNSKLFIEALKLGAEIDGANRSKRTKNALATIKGNGKILGRRVGWRKVETPIIFSNQNNI